MFQVGFCAEGFAMLSIIIIIAEHAISRFCNRCDIRCYVEIPLLAIFAIVLILTMFTIVIVSQWLKTLSRL